MLAWVVIVSLLGSVGAGLGAASFLNIALADLTPYLHRRFGLADSLLHLGLILAVIATIWRLHLPRH